MRSFGEVVNKHVDEVVKHNEYMEARLQTTVKLMHQSVQNQEVHAQRVDRMIDDFAIFHSKVLEKLDNLIEVTKESHSWRDGSGSGEYTDLGGVMVSNEKEPKGGGEGKGK